MDKNVKNQIIKSVTDRLISEGINLDEHSVYQIISDEIERVIVENTKPIWD